MGSHSVGLMGVPVGLVGVSWLVKHCLKRGT